MVDSTKMYWNIQLLNEFQLMDPEGQIRELPTRKVIALLGSMVMEYPNMILRADIAQKLWPTSPRTVALTSSRKAVSLLMKVLGPDSMVKRNKSIGLSPEFKFETDFIKGMPLADLCIELREPPPEPVASLESKQFKASKEALIRRLSVHNPGTSQSKEANSFQGDPSRGLLEMASYFIESNPARTVEILRVNRDILTGINAEGFKDLSTALGPKISMDNPNYGWLLYFRGLAEINSDIWKSSQLLGKATEFAEDREDLILFGESGYFLGLNRILLGKMHDAELVAQHLMQVATKTSNLTMKSRSNHLMGTLKIHRGEWVSGLTYIQEARKGIEDSIFDIASNDALEALYWATIGEIEKADSLLQPVEKIMAEVNHRYISLICRFARALILMNAREFSFALPIIRDFLDSAVSTGLNHFEMYSREALAIVNLNQGNVEAANKEFDASKKMRSKLKANYSEWDAMRLKMGSMKK